MASDKATPGMSSRLLTMKFMQRAAASASPSPLGSQRQGGDSATGRGSPQTKLTPSPVSRFGQDAIKTALEAREQKRLAVIKQQAQELGDSHWVLSPQTTAALATGASSTNPLNVVQVGFAQIDSVTSMDDEPSTQFSDGSPFRRFNMKKSKRQAKEEADKVSDGSSSGNDDSDVSQPGGDQAETKDRDSSTAFPAATRKRSLSKSQDRQHAGTPNGKRRKKDVVLTRLTSISGGSNFGPPSRPQLLCHQCGKPGHKAASCPSRRKS